MSDICPIRDVTYRIPVYMSTPELLKASACELDSFIEDFVKGPCWRAPAARGDREDDP